MTEFVPQSRWRKWWEMRPRILKLTVWPGCGQEPHTEWVVAWGGDWRWYVRRYR